MLTMISHDNSPGVTLERADNVAEEVSLPRNIFSRDHYHGIRHYPGCCSERFNWAA